MISPLAKTVAPRYVMCVAHANEGSAQEPSKILGAPGPSARSVEVMNLDHVLQSMRRVVLRPPGMALPIPALGRSVDIAKVLACEAVADLTVEGEATISDIAAALHLERSTTSRLVGEAEEEGLVVRESHPEDKRRVNVTITPLGREVIAFTQGVRQAYLAHASGVFTDAELATFVTLLTRFSDSLSTTLAQWLSNQTTQILDDSSSTTARTT